MTTVTGYLAIEIARRANYPVNLYTSPVSDAAEALDLEHEEVIASMREDANLIYLTLGQQQTDAALEDFARALPATSFTRSAIARSDAYEDIADEAAREKLGRRSGDAYDGGDRIEALDWIETLAARAAEQWVA